MDSLGDRMKRQYEDRTRVMLPRRTYTILRVDGKAFHTFTRGLQRPFDHGLAACMNHAARRLCEEVQGARLAYVQSDEISVLVTDFTTISTDAWFDGNLQKIVSVAASIATAAFNHVFTDYDNEPTQALFDARAFTIPDPVEVENYFIWRQKDAVRNSIQSMAQSIFPHGRLQGLNCDQLQELIFSETGQNWNDLPVEEKRGRVVRKLGAESAWLIDRKPPTFTTPEGRAFLGSVIPNYEV